MGFLFLQIGSAVVMSTSLSKKNKKIMFVFKNFQHLPVLGSVQFLLPKIDGTGFGHVFGEIFDSE